MSYAEIILPLAGGTYTFSVPPELDGSLVPGCAVSVQFGARKIVGGIVRRLSDSLPAGLDAGRVKPVLGLLFPGPIVSPVQMGLWEWMAQYYMCSPGEVMIAALPALLKPAGFSEQEFAADQFQARRVRCVALGAAVSASQEAFNEACEKLRRKAPKQYEALVELAGLGGGPVPRADLSAAPEILAALAKKSLIVFSEQEAATMPGENENPPSAFRPLPTLSPAQQRAYDGLREALRDHDTALLFGPPASGKSEIYFHAIARTLEKGRDVLLLLPEISLTTQFVGRVRKIFGDRTVLYHSALTDRRRAETYIRLARSGGGSLVVGARSALFLPLKNLGLVVIDEEQDGGFKQRDPAPRYNARDAATVLASMAGARTILASATPSLETWANTQAGKYALVELTERWNDSPPPQVIISDTLRAAKRGERRAHFNKDLLDRLAAALQRGEQTILFQNRRGIAPFVECTDCGHVPRCPHCAIPYTVHRGVLRCHYCGAAEPMPSLCPACGGMNLATRGFGTEKIEEQLATLFPQARIARLDRDSATSERAYRRILGDFEAGATDILVGTQMVTKGLDFAGVSLVGVLGADNLVNHPDFRASERAYSLIAQVAGRAGRHGGGQVVIQTVSPDSPLIRRAAAGDYRAMAADLLAERAAYGYPPYSRLIEVMVRHASRETAHAAATRLAELLRPAFGPRVMGPQPPVVEKIKGEYALILMLKVPRVAAPDGSPPMPLSAARETLAAALDTLRSDPAHRRARLTVDVDPQ